MFDGIIQHTDPVDDIPRAESVNQKFGLLSPLAVHVIHCVRPIPSIRRVPINLIQVIDVILPLRESGNAVTIGKNKIKPSFVDFLDC